jgi:hypothetical protein
MPAWGIIAWGIIALGMEQQNQSPIPNTKSKTQNQNLERVRNPVSLRNRVSGTYFIQVKPA